MLDLEIIICIGNPCERQVSNQACQRKISLFMQNGFLYYIEASYFSL